MMWSDWQIAVVAGVFLATFAIIVIGSNLGTKLDAVKYELIDIRTRKLLDIRNELDKLHDIRGKLIDINNDLNEGADASLGRSNKLLQQGSPSSFLGDQHYEPFPLADETERAPKEIILTDQEVRNLTQWSVKQHIVPPICPHCHINMKWYRSRQQQNGKIIEHQFSCSSCDRTALVSRLMQVGMF